MTELPFEPDAPVSGYGRNRREAWLAGLQANSDMATAAAMQAHRADHDVVTAGQHGIFGAADTPQQLAADVAARPVRIGQDYGGGGRLVEPQGGTFNWSDFSDSPAPAMVDRRYIDRPGQRATGKSPLARYMEGNE